MEELLVQYLEKFLQGYMFSYPQELVKGLGRFLPRILDDFGVDIGKLGYRLNDCDGAGQLFSIIQVSAPLEAIFYYRLERAIFLEEPEHPALPFIASLMRLKTGTELYYSASIGSGLVVAHGVGAVVGPRHVIGRNFTIYQGVTIGQSRAYAQHEFVTIGDDVTLFAGSKVLGKVRVGDGVQLAANSVLMRDADSYSLYAGVPACKVKELPGPENKTC